TVILELAEFEVEQRPGEVLQAALDVMCSAEDPQAIAEAVAAVASVATRDPGTAEGALDEVGVRAGSLTNPPTKAAALAAVAGTQAEPGQRALMAQAFDSIREIPTAAGQVDALRSLYRYAPGAHQNDVLQALRAAARAVEPVAQRASSLRD